MSPSPTATSGSVVRLLRSSVDFAQRMQPKRARRMAEEAMYASPRQRALVDDVAKAGVRMSAAGLGVSAATCIAVRRPDGLVAITEAGADIRSLDSQYLRTDKSVERDPTTPRSRAVLVASACGAAVWAHPLNLLALASRGMLPDPTLAIDLAEATGGIVSGKLPTHLGVAVFAGVGVLASGTTAIEAVGRLEAAEQVAAITASRLMLREEFG